MSRLWSLSKHLIQKTFDRECEWIRARLKRRFSIWDSFPNEEVCRD